MKKILSPTHFQNLIQLENNLEAYEWYYRYPNKRDWFANVVCREKQLLVDDSAVVNELIRFWGWYFRDIAELAAVSLIDRVSKQFVQKGNKQVRVIQKQMTAEDYGPWARYFDEQLEKMKFENHERLWQSLGVSYGKGMEQGLEDRGLLPEMLPWEQYRQTTLFKERAYATLSYMTDDLALQTRMKVAAGVAEGRHPYEIAKELRMVDKRVDVADKIVDGKIVRRGYTYYIQKDRYAEMVARTESARAHVQGRLDAYERTGVPSVQWLSAGDGRVCPICIDLDGNKYKLNEHPPCPRHPDCRCDLVADEERLQGVEQAKVREQVDPNLSDEFYNSHFHRDPAWYGQEPKRMKEAYEQFKHDYYNLTTLQRKQVLRTMLKEYRGLNIIPRGVHADEAVMSRMFQLSQVLRRVKTTQPKLYSMLAKSNGLGVKGTRPTIFIVSTMKQKNLQQLMKKWIPDKTFLSVNRSVLTAQRRNFIKNMRAKNVGGQCYPWGDMTQLYKKGQLRNIIISPTWDKFDRLDNFRQAFEGAHFIHELGHTVWFNTLTPNQRTLYLSIWLQVRRKYTKDLYSDVSWYADTSVTESFPENWVTRVIGRGTSGRYSAQRGEIKEWFDKFIDGYKTGAK